MAIQYSQVKKQQNAIAFGKQIDSIFEKEKSQEILRERENISNNGGWVDWTLSNLNLETPNRKIERRRNVSAVVSISK